MHITPSLAAMRVKRAEAVEVSKREATAGRRRILSVVYGNRDTLLGSLEVLDSTTYDQAKEMIAPQVREFLSNALLTTGRLPQVGEKVQMKALRTISDIKKMTIWGNHSPTMYPDLDNAEINNESVSALINDKDWIENDFLQIVQQRGKAIIDARGASSATSAANAAIDTVKATLSETAENDWFSAAVMSDGSYNVPEGIIFGFPLRASSSGEITIVQNLPISEYAQNKINLTTQELLDEKKDISDLL